MKERKRMKKLGWLGSLLLALVLAFGAALSEAASIVINVVNEKGSNLPSTGGIGTTIFYVIGGVMAAGAAILLVTRRRMGKTE